MYSGRITGRLKPKHTYNCYKPEESRGPNTNVSSYEILKSLDFECDFWFKNLILQLEQSVKYLGFNVQCSVKMGWGLPKVRLISDFSHVISENSALISAMSDPLEERGRIGKYAVFLLNNTVHSID